MYLDACDPVGEAAERRADLAFEPRAIGGESGIEDCPEDGRFRPRPPASRAIERHGAGSAPIPPNAGDIGAVGTPRQPLSAPLPVKGAIDADQRCSPELIEDELNEIPPHRPDRGAGRRGAAFQISESLKGDDHLHERERHPSRLRDGRARLRARYGDRRRGARARAQPASRRVRRAATGPAPGHFPRHGEVGHHPHRLGRPHRQV